MHERIKRPHRKKKQVLHFVTRKGVKGRKKKKEAKKERPVFDRSYIYLRFNVFNSPDAYDLKPRSRSTTSSIELSKGLIELLTVINL